MGDGLQPETICGLMPVTMHVSGRNEAFEQGMRLVRFAVEFRVKLAGNEEWVICNFDNLYQLAIRSEAAENKLGFLKPFPVGVVELIPMPVSFVYHKGPIQPGSLCSNHQLTRLGTQSHRSSFFGNSSLFVEHRNHRIGGTRIKFG